MRQQTEQSEVVEQGEEAENCQLSLVNQEFFQVNSASMRVRPHEQYEPKNETELHIMHEMQKKVAEFVQAMMFEQSQ